MSLPSPRSSLHRAGATVTFVAVSLALLTATASAQTPFDRVQEGWSFFGQNGQPAEVRVGIGGLIGPDYEGSDDYEASVLPAITARNVFGFNFTPFALSYNLAEYNAPGGIWGVSFGPRVAADFGRDQDDNAALAGLGDVDAAIMPGGFINWRLGPVVAGMTVGQDVAGGHEGLVADFSLSTRGPITHQVVVIPGVSASWADDDYMQSYFGVTAAQAGTSAYTAFDANGGFKSIGASLTAIYAINENWAANASLGYERLLGDAADSPLVDGQGSANQASVMLGVTRAFNF
ncbi:MAG: MipA/OmpV family protein [Pseudomonadota bacterium]